MTGTKYPGLDYNYKKKIGKHCESLVCDLLLANHWKIATRNFQKRGFEVDIIAEKASSLLAIEVKYRKFIKNQPINLLISQKQMMNIKRGLQYYERTQRKFYQTFRVDLALVTGSPPSKIFYFIGSSSNHWDEPVCYLIPKKGLKKGLDVQ